MMDAIKYGVFESTNDAIRASACAYERFFSFTQKQRGEIISQLRVLLLEHAEELASMEKSETCMGVYKDKLCQIIKAIAATPGNGNVRIDASSDEDGLVLEESVPFGVACAVHPINHPVASIINNTIMLLAAGNSVINLNPVRAKNTCEYLVSLIDKCILDICGIDNLVICMKDNRHEYNMQIMEHPEVALVVETGGASMANTVLGFKKRVIVAGAANPVAIIDSNADLELAARDLVESVTFDNNLLCTSEKCAVIVQDAYEEFKNLLLSKGAYELQEKDFEKFRAVAFTEDMCIKRSVHGQDAASILVKAGIIPQYDERIKLITFKASISCPFVMNEVCAPILPIICAPDFDNAIVIAKFVEQGYGHSATVFSRDVNHLSIASRQMQTAVFVKNGSSLYGAGIKGNTPITFTIANVTGEGVVTPKHFVKSRKCVLKGAFMCD